MQKEEQIKVLKKGKGKLLSPEEEQRFKETVVSEYERILKQEISSWPIFEKRGWKSLGNLRFSVSLKEDGSIADFSLYKCDGALEHLNRAHIFQDLPKEVKSIFNKVFPDFVEQLKKEGGVGTRGEFFVGADLDLVENREGAPFYFARLTHELHTGTGMIRTVKKITAFIVFSKLQEANNDCYALANFLKRVTNSAIYITPHEQAKQHKNGVSKKKRLKILEEKVSSLQKLNETMKSKLVGLENDNAGLKAKALTYEGLLKNAEADISAMKAKLDAYERYLNEKKEYTKKFASSLNSLADAIEGSLPVLFKKRFKEIARRLRQLAEQLKENH
ncbi:MAG: hypothetical protein QW035_02295 [Candidatus Anstonellales archaeon]